MSANCIFCRIIKGELPSTKIYEDHDVLAIMDIGPIIKGHTLVIPKTHYDPITNVPVELLAKIMAVVQKIAKAQFEGLKADGINVHQTNGAVAGQSVPHVHFHVIPRFKNDGHSWNWSPKKYENPKEMEEIAQSIRRSL